MAGWKKMVKDNTQFFIKLSDVKTSMTARRQKIEKIFFPRCHMELFLKRNSFPKNALMSQLKENIAKS